MEISLEQTRKITQSLCRTFSSAMRLRQAGSWSKVTCWSKPFMGKHWLKKIGASEGIRTLDTHVGNVMLYQAELRSLPCKPGKTTAIPTFCKPPFVRINNPFTALLVPQSHPHTAPTNSPAKTRLLE